MLDDVSQDIYRGSVCCGLQKVQDDPSSGEVPATGSYSVQLTLRSRFPKNIRKPCPTKLRSDDVPKSVAQVYNPP